jgi:glycosyltransferase involved in cell wall biosynthesis
MTKISIIIPNYNHSEYLEQSLDSAVGQSSYPDEIVIIDDASTDNSREIIKKYENFKNVKCIYRRRNKGVLFNVNEGLKISKGEFVLFLAADDFLHPDILREYRSLLDHYPEVGFFCSRYNKLFDNGRIYSDKVFSQIPTGYIPPMKAKNLIHKYGIWPWLSGNTILINKKKAIEHGGYDPLLQSYADGFLYINLAIRHGLVFVSKILSTHRKCRDSYSASTIQDTNQLSLIESRTITLMRKDPEYFDHSFIKRWHNRWQHLKFTSHILYGKGSLLKKFILSSFIFLRYRWFDVKNLRFENVRSFLRAGKSE